MRNDALQKQNKFSDTKRNSVFDRLFSEAKDRRCECQTNSPIFASARNSKSISVNGSKVEDKLLKYGKDIKIKLAQKRLKSHLGTLSLIPNKQIEHNTTSESTKKSLLERFKKLEDNRQMSILQMSEEKNRKEILNLRNTPKINDCSKNMKRTLNEIFNWENNRRLKLEVKQKQKEYNEQMKIIEDMCKTHISAGSFKYLKKNGRSKSNRKQRVEDILTEYGKKSNIRIQNLSELQKYTFRPKTNHCKRMKVNIPKKAKNVKKNLIATKKSIDNTTKTTIKENSNTKNLYRNIKSKSTIESIIEH